MQEDQTSDLTAFAALPQELSMAAASLRQAIEDNQHVPAVFAEFCARAYSRPEWAAVASPFIVECFEQRQRDLAVMARVSDLIIELTGGQQIYTMTVVSQWMLQGDSAQLLKLADALLVAHVNIGGPEVVHLMLALTTALAIVRYSRAGQLLAAAESRCSAEHESSHAEARHWLELGAVLRGCPQSVREMFNHRLRRSRTAWQWQTLQEKAALDSLALQIQDEQPALAALRPILPEGWLEQVLAQARQRLDAPETLTATPSRGAPPPTPAPTPKAQTESPPAPWQRWPAAWQFFSGGVVGIALMMLVIWLSPLDLQPAGRVMTATSQEPDGLPSQDAKGAVPDKDAASLEQPAEPKSSSLTAAVAPLAPQAPAPPRGSQSSEPKESPGPAAAPAPEQVPVASAWVDSQLAQCRKQSAELSQVVEKIKAGQWEDVRGMLEVDASAEAVRRQQVEVLLSWLHLDPPADEETRRRLPQLLAQLRPDSQTLDLWAGLIAAQSPLRPFIEATARRQLVEQKSSWSPSQQKRLDDLGWSSASR